MRKVLSTPTSSSISAETSLALPGGQRCFYSDSIERFKIDLNGLGSDNSDLKSTAWGMLCNLALLTDDKKEIWGMVRDDSKIADTLKAALVSANSEL